MIERQPINFERGRIYRIIDPDMVVREALYISTKQVDSSLNRNKKINCYSFIILDEDHAPDLFNYGALCDGEFITDGLELSLINELSPNRIIRCDSNSKKEFERFAFEAFRVVALQTIPRAGGIKI